MLSFATSARVRTTVVDSAKRRLPHITKAAYHGASPHTSSSRLTGGKWSSKLISYLRKGFAATIGSAASKPSAAARPFLKTAAGRLAAKSSRTMLHRITSRLGANTHVKTLLSRFSQKLHLVPGASRLAARAANPRSWVFASGGRWHPYLNIFSQSLRSLSGPKNISSARVVMAQLQRQALVIGSLSHQRRDLASASPLSHGTKIAIQNTRSRRTPAASGFAANASTKPDAIVSNPAATSTQTAQVHFQASQHLHQVAKAAQDAAAIPIEQCVTITVPYTISSATQSQPGVLSDVARHISDVQRIQQRHTLLLSRLTERLAASGWSIQYRHVSIPTDSIQIALPPSSGILTAAACQDLLCDWGFDLSLFAATVRDPVSPLVQPLLTPLADNATNMDVSPGTARASTATTFDSDDIDSRLFSLIVDQIVDPEEAYREEVRDFLAQIEQMPRLSHTVSTPAATTPTRGAIFARRAQPVSVLHLKT